MGGKYYAQNTTAGDASQRYICVAAPVSARSDLKIVYARTAVVLENTDAVALPGIK